MSIDMLSRRDAVVLPNASAAQPYSDAVWNGDLLLLSGRVGLGPDGKIVDGGVAAECEQAIANIAVVLEQAGLALGDVLRATVYLTSMDDYAVMNQAYTSAFSAALPARTCMAVTALPLGARIEIEVTAGRHQFRLS